MPAPRLVWTVVVASVVVLVSTEARTEENPPAQDQKPPVKRRATLDAGKLTEQLAQTKQIDVIMDHPELWERLQGDLSLAASTKGETLPGATSDNIIHVQERIWKSQGLKRIAEDNCQLSEPVAESLAKTAALLRRAGLVSAPGGRSPSGRAASGKELEETLKESASQPALTQMLQCEQEPIRKGLVQTLATNDKPESSVALAQRAVFDLAPEIRQQAVAALKGRPHDQYRQVFLDAFRHPWPHAADHAADALVALEDREAVPKLEALLDEPDPCAPFTDPEWETPRVRELVRVNHFANCVMRHAPSFSAKDLVRGAVPLRDRAIPEVYYGERRTDSSGSFVRADITYIRQDFSVMQNVENHGPWPKVQRFDYLVRTRAATSAELAAAKKPRPTYPQREAVGFAIAELAGKPAKK